LTHVGQLREIRKFKERLFPHVYNGLPMPLEDKHVKRTHHELLLTHPNQVGLAKKNCCSGNMRRTALIVLVSGHMPAIKYLLLLAFLKSGGHIVLQKIYLWWHR